MSSVLDHAASEGVDIVDKLSKVCHSRYQCPPLSPSYIQEAKSIILMRSTKAGLGVGMRAGHGILLHRLPARTSSSSEAPRWSAPVFLKITVGQVGFIIGYEHVDTFMLAMTRKVVDQLLAGSHTVLGVDQSMVVIQSQIEDKSDVIAASGGNADLVGVSHSSGVMLDFSLSGGALSVNSSKMEEAYGSGVDMAEVIKGVVALPTEMAPLYARLGEMVVGGTTAKVSLTTRSLERMTAGYDPDRRSGSETNLPSLGYEAAASSARSGLQPRTSFPGVTTLAAKPTHDASGSGARVVVGLLGGNPANPPLTRAAVPGAAMQAQTKAVATAHVAGLAPTHVVQREA